MTAREVKKILKDAGWSFVSGGEHQTKAISPDEKSVFQFPNMAEKISR